jgi:DNA-binding XRE family transcriptional regulator
LPLHVSDYKSLDTSTSECLTTERLPFILSSVAEKKTKTSPPASATPASAEKAEFHRRVRCSRVKSGKTRAQIAEALGCKQNTYNNHETRNEMKRLRLVKFCDVTDADIHWLMSGRIRVIGLTAKDMDQLIADDPEPPRPRKIKKDR